MVIADFKKSSLVNYSDEGEADIDGACEKCGTELDSQQMCPNCDLEIDDTEEAGIKDDVDEEEDE